jgi:hypothetical protein
MQRLLAKSLRKVTGKHFPKTGSSFRVSVNFISGARVTLTPLPETPIRLNFRNSNQRTLRPQTVSGEPERSENTSPVFLTNGLGTDSQVSQTVSLVAWQRASQLLKQGLHSHGF